MQASKTSVFSRFMALFQAPPPPPTPLPLTEAELEAQAEQALLDEANSYFKQGICPHCKTTGSFRDGPEGGACVYMSCDECGERWNTMGGRYIHAILIPNMALRLAYLAKPKVSA